MMPSQALNSGRLSLASLANFLAVPGFSSPAPKPVNCSFLISDSAESATGASSLCQSGGFQGNKVVEMRRLLNAGVALSMKAGSLGLASGGWLNGSHLRSYHGVQGVSSIKSIRNQIATSASSECPARVEVRGLCGSSLRCESPIRRRFPTQWSTSLPKPRPLLSQSQLRGGLALQRCLSTSSAVGGDLELNVEVQAEEDMPVDDALKAILEQLQGDAKSALEVALLGVEINEEIESVELSVLLCTDAYISDLNQEWRGVLGPTDVLSFPQDEGPMGRPVLLLGDVVISIDTAARQAEERGHSLLDELRILLIHGMLHVMGYDHETGEEGAFEMATEERHILRTLRWKGSGLITSSMTEGDGGTSDTSEGGQGSAAEPPLPPGTASALSPGGDVSPLKVEEPEREGPKRRKQPAFKYLFLDMDGTLLNSKSLIQPSTPAALLAAIDRGVQIVIATGKARPAALAALQTVGLAGNDRILSLRSPGVFIQGLQVYGTAGKTLHSELLPSDICTEAFEYSVEHKTALAGFSGDRIVTMFSHPKLDVLHDTFFEPKAEVMSSIETLLAEAPVQKLLFYDSVEGVVSRLRPHWTEALAKRATVTQAVSDMLEILPLGANKGRGVALLLDHLNVPAEQVMAVGDGENDLEMIQMAGLGVAMANAVPLVLASADERVASNDEDGIAEAIERFILT